MYLGSNSITDEGVQHLALSPFLGQLKCLDLALNSVSDKCFESIAYSPAFSDLRKLVIGGPLLTSIQPEMVRLLAEGKSCLNLKRLTIVGSGFGDAQAAALSSVHDGWSRLRVLELHDSSLTDVGLHSLAMSPLLANLWVLKISGHFLRIGDDGLRSLAASTVLRNLIDLEIDPVACTEKCMLEITSSPVMSRLDRVQLSGHERAWLNSPNVRPPLKSFIQLSVPPES